LSGYEGILSEYLLTAMCSWQSIMDIIFFQKYMWLCWFQSVDVYLAALVHMIHNRLLYNFIIGVVWWMGLVQFCELW